MKLIVSFSILLIQFYAFVNTTNIKIHQNMDHNAISTNDLHLILNTLRSTQSSQFCPFRLFEFYDINSKTGSTHWNIHSQSETYTTQSVATNIVASNVSQDRLVNSSIPALKLLLRKYQNHCDTIIITFSQHVPLALDILSIGRTNVDQYIFVSSKAKLVQDLFKALPPKRIKYALGVILSPNQATQEVAYFPKSVTKNRVTLNGDTLKITAVHIPPLVNMKNNQLVGGMMYNLFSAASKNFNFTFDAYPGLEGTGRVLSNGTWVGMVGDLLYHRFDLSTTMRVTPTRYGLIDIAAFLWNDDLIFITSLPQRRVPWAAIFQPFSLVLWIFILVALGAITFALCFSLIVMTRVNIEHKLKVAIIINTPHTLKRTIFVDVVSLIKEHAIEYAYSSIFMTISICLDQGTRIQKGTKILVMTWLLSMLVIGTCYKDKLFASLTFPESEGVPRTVEELHARTDYRVIFHYWKSSHFTQFNNSERQIHRDLVKRFILEPSIAKCVLKAVFEPKTVCVGARSLVQVTLASNATLISAFEPASFSGNIFLNDPLYISVGLQRRSTYFDDISKITSMFRDGGFMDYWSQEEFMTYKAKGKSWVNSDRTGYAYQKLQQLIIDYGTITKPLQIRDFYAIFGIHLIGCFSAAIFFVLEIYLVKALKARRKFRSLNVNPFLQKM
ncbi:unnamed protein product [Allacma fusca]|uniref:Uncharacterized protein n=1 Tax=Allacma fusca TaxID=39272 RepID=A0A8J2J3U4_9HEXA|nr:unnamed protein product [Allacma fusca]